MVQLIIFLVLTTVFGWLISLLATLLPELPIVGILFGLIAFGLIGSLLSLYTLVGAVLCVLVFLDVLK